MSYWSDPGAWGPLSGWAGAIATGSAATIAAVVYRRDSNLRRDAQAKKVHASVVDLFDFDKFDVSVTNYSDARIIEPKVVFEKLPWDAVKTKQITYGDRSSVTEEQIRAAYRTWSKTPAEIKYASSEVRFVEANSSATLAIGTRPNQFQITSLLFQDIRGDWWLLRSLLADSGPSLMRMKTDGEKSWLRWARRKLSRTGKTQYDRTFVRQVDRIVVNLKPQIDAEDAAASLNFRNGVQREPGHGDRPDPQH